MRVLVACEFSGRVKDAFNNCGHDAWSCDLDDSESPHKHLKGDVRKWLYDGWDLLIAHPPCKYLCWSGERWIKNNPDRQDKRIESLNFFKLLYNAPIKRICVENSFSWFLRREFMWETQLVHPFNFGEPFRKSTCLWLKNLPNLIHTSTLNDGYADVHQMWPGPGREKNRSRTYIGIAQAMAEQWNF